MRLMMCVFCVAAIGPYPVLLGIVNGGDFQDPICEQPHKYLWKFVDASRELSQDSQRRDDVMDSLECIVIRMAKHSPSGVSEPALYALFHLGRNDPTLPERLVRIITATDFSQAQELACSMFVLSSTEQTRVKLLDFLKDHWGEDRGRWGTGWNAWIRKALFDVADESYRQFLEERVVVARSDRERIRMERELRLLRIADSIPEMLALLESSERIVDREWIVTQLLRVNAPRDEIRSAVLAHLKVRKSEGLRTPMGRMLAICLVVNLLEDEDIMEFESVASAVERARVVKKRGPSWATRHRTRIRELYRID